MTDKDVLDAHIESSRIAFAVLVRALEAEGSIVSGSVSEALRVYMELHRRELDSLALALLAAQRESLYDLRQDI